MLANVHAEQAHYDALAMDLQTYLRLAPDDDNREDLQTSSVSRRDWPRRPLLQADGVICGDSATRSHCASFKQRSRFGEVPFRFDIFPSNSVPVRRKAQRGTGGNSEGRQRVQARKCSPAPISDLHRLAIHSTRIFLCGSFLFTSRSIRRSHGQASCGPKVKILSRSSHFGYTDCEHTGD